MTPCIEVGYRPVKGSKFPQPCYHFSLQPGQAYQIDLAEGKHIIIDIDKSVCDTAEYSFELQWINGQTVALFTAEGVMYAQPIPGGAAPKRAKAPLKTVAARAPVMAPKPGAPAAASKLETSKRKRARNYDTL